MGQLIFPSGSRVYIDTAPIIYSVERHERYLELLQDFWKSAVLSDELEVVTSELTLLETLVQPLRKSDEDLVALYESILTNSSIVLYPITQEILRFSADLRAVQNFKTPDAIHIATAILTDCGYFVTNDTEFKRVSDISVVIVDEIR